MQATAVARFWPKIDTLPDAYIPACERAVGPAQLPFSQKISSWVAEYRRGGIRGNRVLRMPYREQEHLTTPWKWLQHHGKVKMEDKPLNYAQPVWWEDDQQDAAPKDTQQPTASESSSGPPKKKQRKPQFPPSPEININASVSASGGPKDSAPQNVSGSNITVHNNFFNPSGGSMRNNIGMTEFENDEDESEDDDYAFLVPKHKPLSKSTHTNKEQQGPPSTSTKKMANGLPPKEAPPTAVYSATIAAEKTKTAKPPRKNVVPDSSDEEGAHIQPKDKQKTTDNKTKKTSTTDPTTNTSVVDQGKGSQVKESQTKKTAEEKKIKHLKTTLLLKQTPLFIPATAFEGYEVPSVGYWTGFVETNAPRGRPTQIKVKVPGEQAFFVEVDTAIKWIEKPKDRCATEPQATNTTEKPQTPLSSEPSLPSTSDLAEDSSALGDPEDEEE